MYIFIICGSIFTTNIQVELAKKYTLNYDYQSSLNILSYIINVSPNIYNEYHYYSAINYFKLNDKIKADWHLQQLEKSFEPITTRRQQVIIQLMLEDIQNWKKDDLKDIVRDMQISKDKLEISKVDTRTKQAQADIITKLDKLIKEKEKNKSIQQVNGNSNPSKPSTPQSDSQQATTQAKGIVSEKSLQNYEKIWGTLPEKERKRIIAQITNDLPAKYKAEIELYFKSLNKYVKE